jgi:hypothetical protein
LKGFNLPHRRAGIRTFKDAALREAARKSYAWGVGALAGLSIGGWNEMLRVHRHEDARFGFQSNRCNGTGGELPSIDSFIDPEL